jgi:thiol-disulfide isomerase/thioredoxin
VVFLNFWATWCPPCVGEMPSIQRLYDTLKDEEGVVFVCVSDEEPDTVRKFVEEKGYTFPVYTMEGERPEDFRGRGIPTTFILSQDGKISFRHIGSAKWDDQSSIDFIKNLL